MALRFFRRHQKMVVIIMAVLMVSFLIGFQGFQSFFVRKPGKMAIATLKDGTEIIQDDFQVAELDMRLLDRMGFMALPQYLAIRTANPGNESSATYAYVLLLKEADHANIKVTDGGVTGFLQGIGLGAEQYESFVSRILAEFKLPEARLRQAIEHYLMIQRSFVSAVVDAPPSQVELRKLYRDLNETLNLLVARISTEQFMDKVPRPSEEQIASQFMDFRGVRPVDRYRTIGSFGFSYYQPDRIDVTYLLAREDVIDRVTEVTPPEVLKFYRDHEHEDIFKKKVPIPSTQPATAPGTQTAPAETQPAEYHEVRMTYEEAKPFIIEALKNRKIGDTLENLLSRAESIIADFQTDPPKLPPDASKGYSLAYEYAHKTMLLDVERILSQKVTVELDNEPLGLAVEKLAEDASVKICYPWGKHGDLQVDQNVRVKLAGEHTLGEALEEITSQLKLPELRWGTCAGLEGAIFPVSGIEFFPLSLGRVVGSDRESLIQHEILGKSFSAPRGGEPLTMIAFSARGLSAPEARGGGALKVGYDGPRMYVQGERVRGRLLWRLTGAVPAYELKELTPELRREVIGDLKTVEAFRLAVEHAEKLKSESETAGLEAAGKQVDIETTETGSFARAQVISPRQQLFYRYLIAGMNQEQARSLSQVVKPVDFVPSDVPKLMRLPASPQIARFQQQLLERVFELVPEDVEPPYPDKPLSLGILRVPANREVLVLQRIGYEPSVEGEYDKVSQDLQMELLRARRWDQMRPWFNLDKITERFSTRAKSD